ncbi:hypothetical protein A2397_01895 [Candidatus Amesbacteria bacterium RIFOXYB1_FULL_44_23]|uniref:Gluconeogenesis factor n=1 Tax=Candidatus Amesbacteria bacterium RIFOXYB1_FULL_44_23 TaxID=1797263 RepID=A0A1F4ZT38_9BACT|nr:MAG: hypothetical protein A2397_01895 [Candidatus Amesbacteria bacterium RIFOXYB1_FULL_44_23]
MKTTKIVTIGGGTGSPTILKSLAMAGFTDISAVSASTDSGGKTGVIRSDERDRVIAISDLLRNLLALVSDKQNHLEQVSSFIDLVSFTDGRNRNLGYTIYYALLEKYHGDFIKVQSHLEQLLGIHFQGTAIPITSEPANLCFSTSLGNTFCGEHELDKQSLSTNVITHIWLDRPVKATKQAVTAIQEATHIIYSPGSIYGSVISNLLPTGITSALKSSKATTIFVSNLVSNRNQTHRFSPADFLRLFQKYTKLKHPFDYFICPHLTENQFDTKYPKVADTYAAEHSHFLGWTDSQLQELIKSDITPVKADVFSITPTLYRIRHDPAKLARVLKPLLAADRKTQ